MTGSSGRSGIPEPSVTCIAIKERALLAGLPGYADHTAQVRYRLVPGLW
jgi:hypothetical protein